MQASSRLEATVPLGDAGWLQRLRERTEDTVTRPAGSTVLVDADIPPGGPADRPGAWRPATRLVIARLVTGPGGRPDRHSGWSTIIGSPSCTRRAPRPGPARCYAAAFGTAELNSSFCRWPRPAAFPQLAGQAAERVGAVGSRRRAA